MQRLEPSVSGGDYFVSVGAPDEWFGFGGAVLGDEAVDCGLKVDDRVEYAVFEPAPCQFGKEPLNRVQPRG